ncbi:hypothetical protein ACOJIV_07675 [Haloarcula sp. AONF1]
MSTDTLPEIQQSKVIPASFPLEKHLLGQRSQLDLIELVDTIALERTA